MNPDTGHLVRDIASVPDGMRQSYKLIPRRLHGEASDWLGDKSEVYVPRADKSNITQWAANERAKRRKANKLARKARARNRK